MQVQIKVDTRQVERFLQKMPKQIPYAISVALNDTAKKTRTGIVRKVWPRSVDVRARGFAGRAFRTRFANKRSLVAAVYADPRRISGKGVAAIVQLERGERHYPYSSRWLAVPTKNALTPTGRLKAVSKRILQRAEPSAFLKDFGRGPALWVRRRGGLVLMFVLKPSVPTPRKFPFAVEAEKLARANWQSSIRRSVIRAAKSAR